MEPLTHVVCRVVAQLAPQAEAGQVSESLRCGTKIRHLDHKHTCITHTSHGQTKKSCDLSLGQKQEAIEHVEHL